jgi:hypothetical protein
VQSFPQVDVNRRIKMSERIVAGSELDPWEQVWRATEPKRYSMAEESQNKAAIARIFAPGFISFGFSYRRVARLAGWRLAAGRRKMAAPNGSGFSPA